MRISAQAVVGKLASQPYIGAKVGQFLVDVDVDVDDVDNATAFGIYGGYNFDESLDIRGTDIDYNLKTYGLYSTYRYTFPNSGIYAKAKADYSKAEIEVKSDNFNLSDSDTSFAAGLGLGYNINPNISVEADYDYVADDISLLTVGANFKF